MGSATSAFFMRVENCRSIVFLMKEFRGARLAATAEKSYASITSSRLPEAGKICGERLHTEISPPIHAQQRWFSRLEREAGDCGRYVRRGLRR